MGSNVGSGIGLAGRITFPTALYMQGQQIAEQKAARADKAKNDALDTINKYWIDTSAKLAPIYQGEATKARNEWMLDTMKKSNGFKDASYFNSADYYNKSGELMQKLNNWARSSENFGHAAMQYATHPDDLEFKSKEWQDIYTNPTSDKYSKLVELNGGHDNFEVMSGLRQVPNLKEYYAMAKQGVPVTQYHKSTGNGDFTVVDTYGEADMGVYHNNLNTQWQHSDLLKAEFPTPDDYIAAMPGLAPAPKTNIERNSTEGGTNISYGGGSWTNGKFNFVPDPQTGIISVSKIGGTSEVKSMPTIDGKPTEVLTDFAIDTNTKEVIFTIPEQPATAEQLQQYTDNPDVMPAGVKLSGNKLVQESVTKRVPFDKVYAQLKSITDNKGNTGFTQKLMKMMTATKPKQKVGGKVAAVNAIKGMNWSTGTTVK